MAAAPDEGIARVPRGTPSALSFAQRRLWILDQVRPGGTEYLVSAGLRLFGPLQPDALRAALDGIVARHEILRTRYVVVDGDPRQVIDPRHRRPCTRWTCVTSTPPRRTRGSPAG